MARYGYVGRHRYGHPGLMHARELLVRGDQRRGHRWWRLRVLRAKHGGTVIPLPVRSVPVLAGYRRAA
ncbi:MAG: hypothetical protein ABJA87_11525 [bacterium]